MDKISNKYSNSTIRLWFFKAMLLLSVFSFSGFGIQVQYVFSQSIKTELVITKTDKRARQLKRIDQKQGKTPKANSPSVVIPFNVWELLVYNDILKSKFKSYHSRTPRFRLTSEKTLFHISHLSPEEEPFHYS